MTTAEPRQEGARMAGTAASRGDGAPGRQSLAWRMDEHGIHHGSAAGIHLFTVSWSEDKNKPGYVLTTDLPGGYRTHQ